MIIYLIIIRFLVGVIIWVSIAGAIGGCAFGAAYFFKQYTTYKANNEYRF